MISRKLLHQTDRTLSVTDNHDDDSHMTRSVPHNVIQESRTSQGKRKLRIEHVAVDSFLYCLMETLMDETLRDIIRIHQSESNAFEIRLPNLFLEKILPCRFGLSKLGSFQNRLKKYGFQQTSPKLSRLELCGFKAPQKISRKSLRSGEIKTSTPSEESSCFIIYRHPIIKFNDWETFYASVQQLGCISSLENQPKSEAADSSLAQTTALTDYQQTVPSATSGNDILKYAFETLENDKVMRDAGIFQTVCTDNLKYTVPKDR